MGSIEGKTGEARGDSYILRCAEIQEEQVQEKMISKKFSSEKIEVFERMPIRRAVIVQVLPAVLSQMVTLIYNLADTYFVGKLNAPAQSAAVSIALPLFLLLTAISNLFGIGGASALSQSLGKRDFSGAGRIASIAFWWGAAAAVVFGLALWAVITPVLHLVGASADTFEPAKDYLYWTVLLGGAPTVLNMLLANIVRAEGAAGVAAVGVSVGGILNFFLDPFFILPQFLGMGAAGAGLATALSNLLGTSFFAGYVFCSKKTTLSLSPVALRWTGKHIGQILKVGVSSSVQFVLTVVSAAATMKFISLDSTEAVAAYGIQKKLDQLPLYFSLGIASGLLPLLAYNYASGNQKRREAAFRFGVGMAVCFALLSLALFEWKAPELTRLFIDDAKTVALGAMFLRIQIIAQPLVAINYPLIVQFQAMGKARPALVCSLIRKGILDLPLLWILNRLWPLYGCIWVQPVVDCIALFCCLAIYRQTMRHGE